MIRTVEQAEGNRNVQVFVAHLLDEKGFVGNSENEVSKFLNF